MTIMPATVLRNKYSAISDECKASGEPIYLTENGKIDLVVMSIESFERQQQLFDLKERLLDIELEQSNGAKSYSVEELDTALRKRLHNR